MDDKPPLYLLVYVLLIGFIVFAPQTAVTSPEDTTKLSECVVRQPNIPYIPTVRTYGSLIDCLVKYESGGNPNAVGDNGKAKGVLQFWQSTFNGYCVDKYGYSPDDYTDTIVQKDCCQKMLEDNFDNISHWSVKDMCL